MESISFTILMDSIRPWVYATISEILLDFSRFLLAALASPRLLLIRAFAQVAQV